MEVIAEATRPQWDAKFTYEEFVDVIIDGDQSYIEAKSAFFAGLKDFFLRLDQPAMAALVEQSESLARKSIDAMLAKVQSPKVNGMLELGLQKSLRDFDETLDAEMDKIRGE